ncbi:MAG: MFS transporter [Candidatus Binatia bacterium]
MTAAPQRKIYYGWWIVLGALLGVQLGSVAIYFTFGVFLKPIAETFLLSRGEVAFAVSLKSVGSILSAPMIGWLIDRYGVRPVVAVSTLCFASGLLSIRFLPHQMGYLYLFFFLLGFADNGTTFLAYGTLVSRWFERHRGIALGIAMSGAAIGGFLLPPLFHFLIARLGWVNAYAVLAVLSSIMIPIALWVFKESPQELGLLPDGDVPSGSSMKTEKKIINGMTLREASRTPTFWFLGASFSS